MLVLHLEDIWRFRLLWYIWKGIQFQVKQYMKKVGFCNFSGKSLPQNSGSDPELHRIIQSSIFSHSVKTDLMKYRCSCNNLVHFNNLCAKSRQFPFSRQIIMSTSLLKRDKNSYNVPVWPAVTRILPRIVYNLVLLRI